MLDVPSLSEVNDMLDGFPAGFLKMEGRGHPAVDLHELILEWGPLTQDDVMAAQAHVEDGSPSLGVPQFTPIQKLRRPHHRLAQYLAMGVPDSQAAVLAGYHPNRVCLLKQDPAFKELLANYEKDQKAEFQDFVSKAADLSEDMVDHLRDQLEAAPERITPQIALEAIKVLADRSGNAPVTRTINANVNLDMGNRIKAARERAAAALIEQG